LNWVVVQYSVEEGWKGRGRVHVSESYVHMYMIAEGEEAVEMG
jgi:hypothetical protein